MKEISTLSVMVGPVPLDHDSEELQIASIRSGFRHLITLCDIAANCGVITSNSRVKLEDYLRLNLPEPEKPPEDLEQ